MPNTIGIFIIFPTTLFKNIDLIKELLETKQINKIFIIEDSIYFTKFKFHKQKILLHRASLKYYYDYLLINFGTIISYIDFLYSDSFYKKISKIDMPIFMYDPIDHALLDNIKKKLSNINIYENLGFMETYDDLLSYNENIINNKYLHDNFYKWNRTRLNILLDKKNKPLFGKWSFDTSNRFPFNDSYICPSIYPSNFFNDNIENYIDDAKKYVDKYFKTNFGTYDDFFFPITHIQAIKLLNHFLKNKIDTFGTFEDAVSSDIVSGSHSCLSSSLNIGLITAKDCIDATIKKFNKLTSNEQKKQIHNYEGFIRQIIGWRSYMRLLYEFQGKQMYEMNFFNHSNKITKHWYNATTNIYPVDFLINKVKKYAYLHHIERLMYIGNWALLSQINPKQIYKWFMITCIDAYEWVMIPNVQGMSQHSLDNSIVSMMTRPYFSSSNYLNKMSDLVLKNNNWTDIWNDLYYYFIYNNINYLKHNYSVSRQVRHWNNKTKNEQHIIINNARKYLSNL